jgi:hypothetical protein
MTTSIELIERGYFPQELPPPFTTQSLSQALSSIQPLYSNNTKTSRYISYETSAKTLEYSKSIASNKAIRCD